MNSLLEAKSSISISSSLHTKLSAWTHSSLYVSLSKTFRLTYILLTTTISTTIWIAHSRGNLGSIYKMLFHLKGKQRAGSMSPVFQEIPFSVISHLYSDNFIRVSHRLALQSFREKG